MWKYRLVGCGRKRKGGGRGGEGWRGLVERKAALWLSKVCRVHSFFSFKSIFPPLSLTVSPGKPAMMKNNIS